MVTKDKKVVIYLIGRPGSGKYTIANQLKDANYLICHNHLVNDCILSLLDFSQIQKIPSYAWHAIDSIREIVLQFAQTEINSPTFTKSGLVFTNVLYDTKVDYEIYSKVEKVAAEHIFVPVRLFLDYDENVRRIEDPSRKKFYKATSKNSIDLSKKLMKIANENLLDLDITEMTSEEAANRILDHVKMLIEECGAL